MRPNSLTHAAPLTRWLLPLAISAALAACGGGGGGGVAFPPISAFAQKKVPASLQSLQLAPAWTGGTDGALSEQPATDGPGWATLLTGTWVPHHAVRADTADQRIDAKLAPSVFAFAKQKKDAGYLTASVTANTLYPNLLLAETGTLDTAVDCAGADACVTANTTRLIGAGYDLLVAQYSAPAAAAANGLRSETYQRAVSDLSLIHI